MVLVHASRVGRGDYECAHRAHVRARLGPCASCTFRSAGSRFGNTAATWRMALVRRATVGGEVGRLVNRVGAQINERPRLLKRYLGFGPLVPEPVSDDVIDNQEDRSGNRSV